MPTYRKSFGIWVPDKSLSDNRGFISPGAIGAIASGRRRVSGTLEYFGITDTSTYTSFDYWGSMRTRDVVYTCPGSGTRVIQKIEVWCKHNAGANGNIRLAVYDTSLNLLGQGASEVLVNSSTVGWFGHVSTSDLQPKGGSAGDPINLTGGTNYIFAWTTDTSKNTFAYKSIAGSSSSWYAADYRAGFPDPIAVGSSTSQANAFRIQVL